MSNFLKRHRVMILIAVLLATSFSYAYLKTSHNNLFERFFPGKRPPIGMEVNAGNRERINHDTELIKIINYRGCNKTETIKEMPTKEMIGLNKEEFQTMFPDWQIEEFSTQRVRLIKVNEGLCPEHSASMFVGIKDGYVAIFYGKPGLHATILKEEPRKIPVQNLSREDIADLESGIVVTSQDELLKVLEGLASQ